MTYFTLLVGAIISNRFLRALSAFPVPRLALSDPARVSVCDESRPDPCLLNDKTSLVHRWYRCLWSSSMRVSCSFYEIKIVQLITQPLLHIKIHITNPIDSVKSLLDNKLHIKNKNLSIVTSFLACKSEFTSFNASTIFRSVLRRFRDVTKSCVAWR